MCGDMWGDARGIKAPQDRAMKGWCIWQGYVEARSGNPFA
jgi:hypothetical protein